MFIADLASCPEFLAGDATRLRELLNGATQPLDIGYSLAHALVEPGKTSIRHRLRSSEVYYILQGEGLMHINDEQASVRPGQAIYIPPGSIQCIENTGTADLAFLCIVDPAWRPEVEEVL